MPVDRFSKPDRAYLRRALRLARRGQGYVEPNPMVGCVLVRGGRVVGEGWHRRFGGPHAEVEALRRARECARGSTAYVTLEPCCHYGKTPPCTDALIAAGVRQVVAAMSDPFPAVAGGGLRALRRAGVDVRVGLLNDEAAELNAPFLTRVLRRRPYVIAKWAQSLDGKIATRTGDSQWITGEAARRMVHNLRARVDAIVVGIGTVLQDDPLLTARDVPVRRRAVRVVLDSRLRLPLNSRLVLTAGEWPTLVFALRSAAEGRRAKVGRLARAGVTVVPARAGRGGLRLGGVLAHLAALQHTNVLVEGGGRLVGSLMDARLVDEALVFSALKIIGGRRAPGPCAGAGAARLADAIVPVRAVRRQVGDDLLTTVRLTLP